MKNLPTYLKKTALKCREFFKIFLFGIDHDKKEIPQSDNSKKEKISQNKLNKKREVKQNRLKKTLISLKIIKNRSKKIDYSSSDSFDDRIDNYFKNPVKLSPEKKAFKRWMHKRIPKANETSEDIIKDWQKHKKIKQNILNFQDKVFKESHAKKK